MCTAITFSPGGFYFGRTLDYERSYGEEVVLAPRNCPLTFRQVPDLRRHHGILGMAHVADGYPLYYDAMNEKGLCMAGLNFVHSARYDGKGKFRVAAFELIPWVLGQCETVEQARRLLSDTAVTGLDFSPDLPAARLHWLIADRSGCIAAEAMGDCLFLHDDPVGVLTNEPPFAGQLRHLANFMHLSPEPPRNLFSERLDLRPYSRGMGAMGLPGDLSSQSRFVRAAFAKLNAVCSEKEEVSQFFHILGTVEQVKGCCRLEDGSQEHTLYTSCCDAVRGIYHYITYGNRRITAVDMKQEDLDGMELVRFPLLTCEDIRIQKRS